jgi:predicted O-linked N-acetylglucosamine transferase (SPINDLY family)
VFGVVSPLAHVDAACLDAWAEILLAAPDSRLLWLTDTAEADTVTRERFKRLMALREIAPERIDMRHRLEDVARQRAIGEMALVLDSLPVSLGTAALECLWCGTPVLSLRGDAPWRSTAAGLLTAAGLGAWVAAGRDDYIAKAVACSGATAASREGLRQRLLASPIMDAAGFADAFGRAIEGMWDELSA